MLLPGSRPMKVWLGRKDSNLRMPESKSGALTNLATPQYGRTPMRATVERRAFSRFSPRLSNQKQLKAQGVAGSSRG
jgi:hypothetical protein